MKQLLTPARRMQHTCEKKSVPYKETIQSLKTKVNFFKGGRHLKFDCVDFVVMLCGADFSKSAPTTTQYDNKVIKRLIEELKSCDVKRAREIFADCEAKEYYFLLIGFHHFPDLTFDMDFHSCCC